MKASEVYLLAAQALDAQNGPYSGACMVINEARAGPLECRTDSLCHGCALRELFDSGKSNVYWLGGIPNKNGKPVRVLALLLMSAIAQDEERR